jgi:hypothetical protein
VTRDYVQVSLYCITSSEHLLMVKRHASGRMSRRIESWQLMLSVAMVICLMRLCSARGMSDAEINEEIDFHKDTDTPPGDDDDSYISEHPFSGGPNAAAEHG